MVKAHYKKKIASNILNATVLFKHAFTMDSKASGTNTLISVVGHDPKIILPTFLEK